MQKTTSMKRIALFLWYLCITAVAYGQPEAETCTHPQVLQQADSIISNYHAQGFRTYKRGAVKMERNTEFPILLNLERGKWYAMGFVGQPDAQTVRFDLMNSVEYSFARDIVRKQRDKTNETHFEFIAPESDRYLIYFSQKTKEKNPCGYFFIMIKDMGDQKNYKIPEKNY